MKKITPNKIKLIKNMLFFASLFPVLSWLWMAWQDSLGSNPIEFLIRESGTWCLRFLLLGLCITPLRRLLHWSWMVQLRRQVGLFAFFYGVLHFFGYIWLDQFFDWAFIVQDIISRPFILVGVLTLTLLCPLAITSTQYWMRRLGGKRWQKIHYLVYPAAILAVIHYLMLVKIDITRPLIYGFILLILLLARIKMWYKK